MWFKEKKNIAEHFVGKSMSIIPKDDLTPYPPFLLGETKYGGGGLTYTTHYLVFVLFY